MSILIHSLVLLPITTSIVKYRLSYYPQRDGPTLPGVANKIYKSEGWQALYNGLVPSTICFIVILLGSRVPKWLIMPAPLSNDRSHIFTACITNIWFTLALTWVYRTISTPRQLSLSQTSINNAFETLFTSYERSSVRWLPVKLLATPGLVPSVLVNLAFRILIVRPIRNLVEPDHNLVWKDYLPRLAATWVFLLAATLLVCAPLDVVVTRLVVRRNHGPTPSHTQLVDFWKKLTKGNKILVGFMGIFNIIALIWLQDTYNVREWTREVKQRAMLLQLVTVGLDCLFLVYFVLAVLRRVRPVAEDASSAMEEPPAPLPIITVEDKKPGLPSLLPEPVSAVPPEVAIKYRPEDLPQYSGLYDCATKIIQEEGWPVLYRGWWITLLGMWIPPS